LPLEHIIDLILEVKAQTYSFEAALERVGQVAGTTGSNPLSSGRESASLGNSKVEIRSGHRTTTNLFTCSAVRGGRGSTE